MTAALPEATVELLTMELLSFAPKAPQEAAMVLLTCVDAAMELLTFPPEAPGPPEELVLAFRRAAAATLNI